MAGVKGWRKRGVATRQKVLDARVESLVIVRSPHVTGKPRTDNWQPATVF